MAIKTSLDTARDAIVRRIEELTTGDAVYANAIYNLCEKYGEPVPQSKNPVFQEELNRTHAIYQQWIKARVINIIAQFNIAQELKTLFRRQIDPVTITNSLTQIQSRFRPLLQEFRVQEDRIKRLEDRIQALMAH